MVARLVKCLEKTMVTHLVYEMELSMAVEMEALTESERVPAKVRDWAESMELSTALRWVLPKGTVMVLQLLASHLAVW